MSSAKTHTEPPLYVKIFSYFEFCTYKTFYSACEWFACVHIFYNTSVQLDIISLNQNFNTCKSSYEGTSNHSVATQLLNHKSIFQKCLDSKYYYSMMTCSHYDGCLRFYFLSSNLFILKNPLVPLLFVIVFIPALAYFLILSSNPDSQVGLSD